MKGMRRWTMERIVSDGYTVWDLGLHDCIVQAGLELVIHGYKNSAWKFAMSKQMAWFTDPGCCRLWVMIMSSRSNEH